MLMIIAVIMLAAGNSRRFGSNKLLFEIEGRPMYQHTLDKLAAIPDVSLTVVTQYDEVAQEAMAKGARVLYNPHPDEGISSSLKIGLKANLDADACLFAVADQPWLSQDTPGKLIQLFLASGKGIACVSCGGKLGNPCIFSQKYYPELLELTGDTGGKHVITAHREDTALLPVEDSRELTDVDCRKNL